MMSTVHRRQTKYCLAIEKILHELGHATNNDILYILRHTYPKLSATTVHRVTARLAERGIIALAPSSHDGSMCYDQNIEPHDHFQCTECGALRDADIKDKVSPIIESSIGNCRISGRLTVRGVCKQCM